MNRVIICGLTALCCLLGGSTLHADQIQYSFSTSSPSLFLDQHSFGGFFLTHNSGVVPASVTTTSKSATISTDVLAFSFAPHSAAQQIDAHINLTLTDKTSSGTTLSQTLHLGELSGTMSVHGTSLQFHSSGLQKATFGDHTYKVSFASSTVQPVNWFLSSGQLKFTISDPPAKGQIGAVPEPSSFLLAGIGVPLLGVYLRRRRSL